MNTDEKWMKLLGNKNFFGILILVFGFLAQGDPIFNLSFPEFDSK